LGPPYSSHDKFLPLTLTRLSYRTKARSKIVRWIVRHTCIVGLNDKSSYGLVYSLFMHASIYYTVGLLAPSEVTVINVYVCLRVCAPVSVLVSAQKAIKDIQRFMSHIFHLHRMAPVCCFIFVGAQTEVTVFFRGVWHSVSFKSVE